MNLDEMIFSSVSKLIKAIRDREISSEELVQCCLERIGKVNPQLNAVVQLSPDQALARAKEADAALARSEIWGPLHGIPMTIKDSLDTAGVISTGGTVGRAQFVPEKDATVVARLKGAGAILLGKTNTPELTLSFETDNAIYGRTNNPYDVTRSPGGSSGGAAAIVAAGGAPFDIGSDYGGSIRLPSHFCGIAGIKPTSGRVPRTGHIIPYAAGAADAYQQLGPMARTVGDLALLLPIIAGPDWQDPAIVPMPWLDSHAVQLKHLRVTFHTDNGAMTPIPEIIETVTQVAHALEPYVAFVEEKRPERLGETWELWSALHGADGGQGVRDILRQAGTAVEDRESTAVSGEEFGDRIRAVDQFRSQMLAFMSNYDVMICPTNTNVAIKHGTLDDHMAGFSYTATYNITGWPGAVVRAGTSAEGLPIGVQILGCPWCEDIVLAVAQFVETAFGGWQPPEL